MLYEYKDLLEAVEENDAYDKYLEQHIQNVKRGYHWMKEHLPEVLDHNNYVDETRYYGELDEIIDEHDASKYNKIPNVENYYELTCEYDAYADYFYGKTKSAEVETAFDYAWLAHIHANPHHWQHWVLHNDTDGTTLLDMPYVFIIEMICDHWSFSWKSGNLHEMFEWYDQHKQHMMLSDKTKKTVESIHGKIKQKLEELHL